MMVPPGFCFCFDVQTKCVSVDTEAVDGGQRRRNKIGFVLTRTLMICLISGFCSVVVLLQVLRLCATSIILLLKSVCWSLNIETWPIRPSPPIMAPPIPILPFPVPPFIPRPFLSLPSYHAPSSPSLHTTPLPVPPFIIHPFLPLPSYSTPSCPSLHTLLFPVPPLHSPPLPVPPLHTPPFPIPPLHTPPLPVHPIHTPPFPAPPPARARQAPDRICYFLYDEIKSKFGRNKMLQSNTPWSHSLTHTQTQAPCHTHTDWYSSQILSFQF